MIKSVRGTKDILPDEAGVWQKIEDISRDIFAVYGYKEIRTPFFEEVELFRRSVGETSDIVTKEMYVFPDRGGRNLALRPEATASVVRAYIEHNLDKKERFVKLYYIGPMFRGERPQSGRNRQFNQIGVEALGSSSPHLDCEVISLFAAILNALGISGFTLSVNNAGCRKDRKENIARIKKALFGKTGELCPECQDRYERNVFRVFDCKNEPCREIAYALPSETISFCDECDRHFSIVKDALSDLHINFKYEPHLARGLDYYTKTVFEVTHPALGAKDAIGAGGRYDDLIYDMGGPPLGAVGFALGVERTIMALGEKFSSGRRVPSVYIATLGEGAYRAGFKLLAALRDKGVASCIDYEGKSLKAQMRAANDMSARYVALIGEDELEKGGITLKDMSSGEEQTVKTEELIKKLMTNV